MALDTAGGINGYSEKTLGFLKDAAQPITVGENAEVGTGARLKQKAMGVVGGMLGSAIGGLLGGRSGGGDSPFGGRSSRPRGGSGDDIEIVDDPIAKEKKRIFTDPASGTKIAIGTQMTPGGLLVSTNILESPNDDSTFQTIYLMDPEGRKAGPTGYDVYEMYADWKLTVTWTEDHYVNGKHVLHKEGGWSEEGRDILGTFTVPREGEGIWSKLGFSNAAQGVKSLGTSFPISLGLLAAQPMSLVIHVTTPDEDPVTTVPFVIGISEDCPCATQQMASILDQLPSDEEAEELEARRRQQQERLRGVEVEIEESLDKIAILKNTIQMRRYELERAAELIFIPARRREKETLAEAEEAEQGLEEEENRLEELRRLQSEIKRQLDPSAEPPILTQLETGRQNDPCGCGTPQIQTVNMPHESITEQ